MKQMGGDCQASHLKLTPKNTKRKTGKTNEIIKKRGKKRKGRKEERKT